MQGKTNIGVHPLNIITLLSENIEVEFCKPLALRRIIAHISERLVEMYDPMFERILIKENILRFMRPQGKALDEQEQLVDEILQYREALIKTLEFISEN